MHDTIFTLPGKKRKSGGMLQIELTEANLAHIMIRHAEIEMDDILRAWWAETLIDTSREIIEIGDYPWKTKPYQHQVQSLQQFAHLPYYALWWEMGAGKTKADIDIAAWKYLKGEIENYVIIAPNGVHRQWILEQIPTHLPDQIQRSVIFTTGSTKSRNIGVEDILSRKNQLRIFSVNMESISHKSGLQLLKKIVASGPTKVTVDESSGIKGYKSSRTEAAHEVARMESCVARACLDGTPISQGAEDLYGPLEFLSPKILACPNYFAFRSRYLVMGGQRNDKVVAYKNLEDLQKRMYSVAMRVLKKDCLDLPGCIPMMRYVEMTEEQERYYNDMKDLFLAEIENGEVVTVKDAMVRINKLQQILGGFLITKHEIGTNPIDGKKIYENRTTQIGTSKLDAALDLVREHGKRTIIWVNFREEADMFEKFFKEKTSWKILRYTGKEDSDLSEKNKQSFMGPEEEQIMITSMKGSRGLNLPQCSLMIWASFPRKYLDYRQGNERTDRPGQTEKTTIAHLMVPKTVDQKAFATLMRKEDFATMMLDIRDLL